MTTIREVARASGFGQGTVSRALNGGPRVRPETRAHVIAVAEQLGYRPNPVAQALRTKSSRTVGLIVPDLQNEFFMAGAEVVQDRLAKSDYRLIVGCSNNNDQLDQTIMQSMAERRVDAILHVPCTRLGSTWLAAAFPDLPVVEFGRRSSRDDVDSVVGDEEIGAAKVVSHLVERGHSRIAMITGPSTLSTSKARIRGFRRGLRAAKLVAGQCPISSVEFTPRAAESATDDLLREHPDVTAIFAATSRGAAGVMRALHRRHILVPEDVSVVGFLDPEWFDSVHPSVTCYRLALSEMGTAAAILLLERLSQAAPRRPRRLVVPGELMVRESTAPKPIKSKVAARSRG
jgi:LacI family transcriptional regulator, galactose operon repressor